MRATDGSLPDARAPDDSPAGRRRDRRARRHGPLVREFVRRRVLSRRVPGSAAGRDCLDRPGRHLNMATGLSSAQRRDERIEAAIAHWAPRCTPQGVDPNDFARVTAPLETWPEWLPPWFENGDRHARLARAAERAGRLRSAGEAWVHAALSYHFAKFVWMVDMELHREGTARALQAIGNFHRLLDPTAERVEIP